jgi:putative Mg2+ transporter-C (MgtC) family protein
MDIQIDWPTPQLHLPDIVARLLLAIVCGAVIGWERETHHKAAGLRTHMMVCLGSAGFMLAGMEVAAVGMLGSGNFDPNRIIQGVIQGIGFLGAGSIIQSRGSVHGTTTAAGIWVAGGIGACAGAGLYLLSLVFTAFAYIILKIVLGLEHRLKANGASEANDPGDSSRPDAPQPPGRDA